MDFDEPCFSESDESLCRTAFAEDAIDYLREAKSRGEVGADIVLTDVSLKGELTGGDLVRQPLGEMKVKSEIMRPSVYERLTPNQPYSITKAELKRFSRSSDGLFWAIREKFAHGLESE